MCRVLQQKWLRRSKRSISSVENFMVLLARSLIHKTRSSKSIASRPRTDKKLTLSKENFKAPSVRLLRPKE